MSGLPYCFSNSRESIILSNMFIIARIKHFPVLLLVTLFLGSCAGLPDRSAYLEQGRSTPGIDGLEFGLCHAGYSLSDEEYALLDEMRVQWMRIDFSWNNLEKEPGVWDFEKMDAYVDRAVKGGKKILAILDYDTAWLHMGKDKSRRIERGELPRYLNYVEKVVKRYGRKLDALEIWNEPNTSRFWTASDDDFFRLTNETLDLLDRIAPDIPVAVGSVFYHPILGAGLYIGKLIDAGILDKADALSIHPYSLTYSVLEDRVATVRNRLADEGYDTPVWITEMGFPTGGGYPHRISLDEQAEVVAKSLTMLAASGAELVIWYELRDSRNPEDVEEGMSSEAFFGLAYPDFRKKPGAIPYSILARTLKGAKFIPEMWPPRDPGEGDLYQAHFALRNGSGCAVLWTLGGEVSVKNPGGKIVDLTTGQEVLQTEDLYDVTVGTTPLLFTW